MRDVHPLGIAVVAAILLQAGTALAHGDFPQSTDVVFQDPADELPLVVTTFGVLIPRSAEDWTWVCEDVTGADSVTSFEALPSGRWLFGTIGGLWRSDDLCDWQKAGAPLDGLYVTQISRDAADPRRVWVATASGDAENALWRSDDGGDTFTAHATFGEGATVRGFLQGEDGAPHWVFGWRDGTPYLWYSEDGAAFTESPIGPIPDGASVYPLGLDAHDPTVAYLDVRVLDPSYDALVRVSADGTATTLLEVYDEITAFATGPEPGEIRVGGRNVGTYASSDGGATWSGPEEEPEPGCLVDHDGRRYQCANNWADGASVLVSPLGSEEWEPLQRFEWVCEPYACPEGSTTAEVCGPLWEETVESAGLCPAGPEQNGEPEPGPEGGCPGCATAGPGEAAGAALAGALLPALGWLRRRAGRSWRGRRGDR